MTKGIVHVCALATMPHIVASSRAGHLISLINAEMLPATPPHLAPERHMKLVMNDIAAPREGLIPPGVSHVEQLIAFVQEWDRQAPLVVHCWAGISRSSAAAYIAMAALRPDADELELARSLRAASPTATPNQRLVALADASLGRDGRMIRAIAAIGRGASAFEGAPYILEC